MSSDNRQEKVESNAAERQISSSVDESVSARSAKSSLNHPSRKLELRSKGFGIGGGYERRYRVRRPVLRELDAESYGPLPPAGYYGAGQAARPFKAGEATFDEEMAWYQKQYGRTTSGYREEER